MSFNFSVPTNALFCLTKRDFCPESLFLILTVKFEI